MKDVIFVILFVSLKKISLLCYIIKKNNQNQINFNKKFIKTIDCILYLIVQ